MTQKTEGYVELEWTCPNCQSNNPGPQKTCRGCGNPQPVDVQFHLPLETKIKTDEATAKQAASGPDIHCPYCGARNVAGAPQCTQCGGDLGGGTKREAGQVVGAFSSGPAPQVPCPACGSPNRADALQCAKCGSPMARPKTAAQAAPGKPFPVWLIVVLVLVVACGLIFLFQNLFKTEAMTGTVQEVSWKRTIAIEAQRNVTRQDWKSEIPSNVALGKCTKQYRNSQDQPAPVATEVCGTAYVVDQGSGVGKVVKDCKYQVYEDRCEYTVQEWQQVDQAILQGADLNPRWPTPNLATGQRTGKTQEQYTVMFSTSKGTLKFQTSNYKLFAQCTSGSTWNLEVNSSNEVVSISAPQ